MEKPADSLLPLNALVKRRWSPRAFSDQPVPDALLQLVFEAARWSASSFNEQPWSFVYAERHLSPQAFAGFLSCLNERNQAWAKRAPLLIFALTKQRFDNGGKPNRHAEYDLGQSVATMSLQATESGLSLHQMAGFDPDKARLLCKVPDTHTVLTAIAMGYGVREDAIPPELKETELAPREREAAASFVFKGNFGESGLYEIV
jgi:nitroreductase